MSKRELAALIQRAEQDGISRRQHPLLATLTPPVHENIDGGPTTTVEFVESITVPEGTALGTEVDCTV